MSRREVDDREIHGAGHPDASAHHLLGNLLYGLGQRDEGRRHWREALERNGRLSLTWRNVACAEVQLDGDDRAALEAYDQASWLREARAHALRSLSRAHSKAERDALLQEILDERNPRPALGTYYQALALEALGRPGEARALLDRLEETARADAGGQGGAQRRAAAHYLLSVALEKKGDESGADAELQKAREFDPRPERRALTRAQVEFAGAHQ